MQSVGFPSKATFFSYGIALYELDWCGIRLVVFYLIMIVLQRIGLQLAQIGPYLELCLEKTFVVIWHYMNKTELN